MMNQGGMIGTGMSVGNPSSLTMAGGTMTMTNGNRISAILQVENIFVSFYTGSTFPSKIFIYDCLYIKMVLNDLYILSNIIFQVKNHLK